MFIPLSGITTSLTSLVMLSAWVFIGQRLKQSPPGSNQPVHMLRSYFFHMTIFMTFLWLPYIWLIFSPKSFPLAMAISYSVGHIFIFLASTAVARMTFQIIPKLNSKEKLMTIICYILGAAITVVNAVTMIWGSRPAYDYTHGVTLLNASPIVGPAIGIFALLTVVPAAILFIINAFKSSGARRVRSMLLGFGLLVLMIGGPLHDNAPNSLVYAIADILTITSGLAIGFGVAYQIEQSLAINAPVNPALAPSSNTV